LDVTPVHAAMREADVLGPSLVRADRAGGTAPWRRRTGNPNLTDQALLQANNEFKQATMAQ
jgi:hypothetical protein